MPPTPTPKPSTSRPTSSRSPSDGYTILERVIAPDLVDALTDDLARLEANSTCNPRQTASRVTTRCASTTCSLGIASGNRFLCTQRYCPWSTACSIRVRSSRRSARSQSCRASPRNRSTPTTSSSRSPSRTRPRCATRCGRSPTSPKRMARRASSRDRTSPTVHPTLAHVRVGRRGDAEGLGARVARLLWHGGGANTTGERRVGIAMNYCAGWIRQQENQQLGIRARSRAVLAPPTRARGLRRLQHADRPHRQAFARRAARRRERRRRSHADGVGRG